MRVLIAGGHGKIGRRIVRLLAERGDVAVAMIRDAGQADEIRDLGGEPLVADLTGDVSDAAQGVEAIVFTAGAGPGSGPGPKETVDKGGAVKLVDAARNHGVRRYVIVSSMNADQPTAGPPQMEPYYRAKGEADAYLAASGLDFTIIRPGRLTDDAGDGRVEAARHLGRRGSIPRDDVAATVVAALDDDRTIGATFELLDGDTPIAEALASL